jgi:multidrug resistance efflux pump
VIDTSNWYVQANFKESELSEIRPGTTAVIRLRQYPGKIYSGIVESSRLSAEKRLTAPRSGMTEVKKENEWFLLPQRFPVQIKITNPDHLLNFGASAYVSLDIPSRPFRQFFWELFL